jgi:hypothetical protein
MRRATVWIGGLIGWLTLVGSLPARDAKDATVRVPSADVRGGRSEIFPITGYVRQGQTVRIIGDEGDFCAIVPPPGSSSWIKDHDVKPEVSANGRRPDKAYVLLDNVEVQLGSEQVPRPLQYVTAKLNRGTIVRIIGDKVFFDGKEWWRIQPPPGDVRYVAKESLNLQTSTVVASSPAAAARPAQVVSNQPNQPTNPLWIQAQQAEQIHDYARAVNLYGQLAGEMAQPNGDHDLAMRCYNRIEQLNRGQTANWPARQQAPGMLVAGRPVSSAPPAVSSAPAPGANAPPAGSIASGPGWLRRTGILIDGKPAFVLEDNRGQPKYYLLGQPGLNPDLDAFANRPIEVFGTVVPRTDLVAGSYLAVYRIQPLR